MIISASRRTDIPAFYSDWFYKRIEEGYVYVVNPMNRKQVSKIFLNPDTVECFVFWTKNAKPMMDRLFLLDEMGFQYYFQFTITSYHSDIEPGIVNKNDVIHSFQKLSEQIGKEKVIWRYDPIFLTETYTLEYHEAWFEAICKRLSGYTEKCVISFIDMYRKTMRNSKDLRIQEFSHKDMIQLAKMIGSIAKQYNIKVETCSEAIDLSQYGIEHGKCIDDRLISRILGTPLKDHKDLNQRKECGCIESIDIGKYDTCKHFCKYCYANYSLSLVHESCTYYNVDDPILASSLKGDEKITLRKMKSMKRR